MYLNLTQFLFAQRKSKRKYRKQISSQEIHKISVKNDYVLSITFSKQKTTTTQKSGQSREQPPLIILFLNVHNDAHYDFFLHAPIMQSFDISFFSHFSEVFRTN